MKINHERAKDILLNAYSVALSDKDHRCIHSNFLDFILMNKHLTFRYVLFTAVLAKATNSDINPLCLQAGSTLAGAYDARSLCHKVVVPFEISELNKAMGGSNEPFLNKPARFPELNITNPVKKGNDQLILNALCENLPKLRNSDDAFNCLVYLLQKLVEKRNANKKLTELKVRNKGSNAIFHTFLDSLMDKSFEGEILTLVVACLYYLHLSDEFTINVNPVNQSGASSKEISDLDILKSNTLYIGNELKDKTFTVIDIKHATDKVITAGGNQMLFIYGKNVEGIPVDILELKQEYLQVGFSLRVVPINYFLELMLTLIEDVDVEKAIRYMVSIALNTKFKEETVYHLINTADVYFEFDLDSC